MSKKILKIDTIEKQKDEEEEETEEETEPEEKVETEPEVEKVEKIKTSKNEKKEKNVKIIKNDEDDTPAIRKIKELQSLNHGRILKVRKPPTQDQIRALDIARRVRVIRIQERNDLKAKDKKDLEKLLEVEIASKVVDKYGIRLEKKIKRELLAKMKANKLKELKEKYNYTSDIEDSEPENTEEEEEEEEEEQQKPKKKTVKYVERESPLKQQTKTIKLKKPEKVFKEPTTIKELVYKNPYGF